MAANKRLRPVLLVTSSESAILFSPVNLKQRSVLTMHVLVVSSAYEVRLAPAV